jgi:hypothetical protein
MTKLTVIYKNCYISSYIVYSGGSPDFFKRDISVILKKNYSVFCPEIELKIVDSNSITTITDIKKLMLNKDVLLFGIL